MIKKIKDLTKRDKESYFEAVKRDTEKLHGIPWEVMEKKIQKDIQKDIDDTFDDKAFAKMDPEFAIDAAYARKEFGKKKPDIIDYMIWAGTFVTHSDFIEIPD